ncbi:MAG: hypothetical protein LBG48_03545 [Rickettsiales bacterium]|nr:hypothetical protein [Rickettsiales bacterium]
MSVEQAAPSPIRISESDYWSCKKKSARNSIKCAVITKLAGLMFRDGLANAGVPKISIFFKNM